MRFWVLTLASMVIRSCRVAWTNIYFEGINVRGFRGLSLYRKNLYPRKFMNSRRVQYYGFEANGVEVHCM